MMSYKSAPTLLLYIIAINLILLTGCTYNAINSAEDTPVISEEEARNIAHEDASYMYRDLSIYEVTATLTDGNWYVDYKIRDPNTLGGGPHYVISSETGEIISFRYDQ